MGRNFEGSDIHPTCRIRCFCYRVLECIENLFALTFSLSCPSLPYENLRSPHNCQFLLQSSEVGVTLPAYMSIGKRILMWISRKSRESKSETVDQSSPHNRFCSYNHTPDRKVSKITYTQERTRPSQSIYKKLHRFNKATREVRESSALSCFACPTPSISNIYTSHTRKRNTIAGALALYRVYTGPKVLRQHQL